MCLPLQLTKTQKHANMPGTWYTSKAIFTDLVEDERKDKFDDDVSGAVGRTN